MVSIQRYLAKNMQCKKFDASKIACNCKLTYNKPTKNFYLYIPQYIVCKQPDNNRKPVCGLDPGEKVFMAYFSLDHYGLIGNDIRKRILEIQSKIKHYQRLLTQTTVGKNKVNKKNKKGKPIKRWKIKKKINKLYIKIKGIVNELHKKTALFLCRNYSTILIPEFKTRGMVANKTKTQRSEENLWKKQ